MFKFLLNVKTDKDQLILEYILNPLSEAYGEIRQDKKMVYSDEDRISSGLVWHLKYSSSLKHLYKRNAVSIVLRPKEQYTIDDIYEPDIKIIVRGIQMEIESKRIHRKNHWSVYEYLSNKRGIGRFLWGVYSHNSHGAMIGYIQKGDFHAIVTRIKTGLKEINCRKCEDIQQIEHCVLSVHYRSKEDKENIKIYHLFFYFS